MGHGHFIPLPSSLHPSLVAPYPLPTPTIFHPEYTTFVNLYLYTVVFVCEPLIEGRDLVHSNTTSTTTVLQPISF